jgi:hypothetical protein
MATPKLKSTAVLIGYNPSGRCVYSDIMDLRDYCDGGCLWKNSTSVKRLKLAKIHGYLFDADGVLETEFEKNFDIKTGLFDTGYTKYADGSVVDKVGPYAPDLYPD